MEQDMLAAYSLRSGTGTCNCQGSVYAGRRKASQVFDPYALAGAELRLCEHQIRMALESCIHISGYTERFTGSIDLLL